MSNPTVWTFFYGSNMDPGVLKAVDYTPEHIEVAKLWGYDIVIAPLANLERADQHCVYGILATGTHEDLERLYGEYVHAKLGATYLPHPVFCENQNGGLVPALCYLCSDMKPASTSDEYLDKIVIPAKTYGFPEWYVNRLEEFRGR